MVAHRFGEKLVINIAALPRWYWTVGPVQEAELMPPANLLQGTLTLGLPSTQSPLKMEPSLDCLGENLEGQGKSSLSESVWRGLRWWLGQGTVVLRTAKFDE